MTLINKYIYEVTKRLATEQRNDVARELESIILDMLPDDYTEVDVRRVLTELGSPKKLAQQYRDTKSYLIGPDYYDLYIDVLKLALKIGLPIVIALVAIAHSFELIGDLGSVSILTAVIRYIARTIGNSVSSFINIIVIITIGFIIIERTNALEKEDINREWIVDDLDDVVIRVERQIPLSDGIGTIIAPIVGFMFFVIAGVSLGSIIFVNGQNIPFDSVFAPGMMLRFVPFVAVATIISVFTGILMIVERRWTKRVIAMSIIDNLVSAIVTIAFVMTPNVINPVLISTLHDATQSKFEGLWVTNHLPVIISVIIVIVTIISIVALFVKASDKHVVSYKRYFNKLISK